MSEFVQHEPSLATAGKERWRGQVSELRGRVSGNHEAGRRMSPTLTESSCLVPAHAAVEDPGAQALSVPPAFALKLVSVLPPHVSGTSHAGVPVPELRVTEFARLPVTQSLLWVHFSPALVPQAGVPVVRLGPVISWGRGLCSQESATPARRGVVPAGLLLCPSCLS